MSAARLAHVVAFLASTASVAQVENLSLTAAPSPTLATQSVSVQGASLSASFEGGKDGKKLTGRGTISFPGRHFGGRVHADISISAAEYDEKANEARVLHAFDHDPGGTLAAGLTWDTFDVHAHAAAAKQVRQLCAAHLANKDLEECDTREQLPEAEQKQVTALIPASPSLIANLRVHITTQYTRFFDPVANKKLDDLAWPGGVTAGWESFSPRPRSSA